MLKYALSVALMLTLVGAPAVAVESVQGTLAIPGGQFEFVKVKVVDTYSDGFMSYWVGEIYGKRGSFLYDPFNRIWVQGPINYVPSVLPFGYTTVDGVMRTFGSGFRDQRFFFGDNGHTYWRFDKYRKRPMQTNRRKRILEYSFWIDLDTQTRGPAYKYANGQLYVVPEGSKPAWHKDLNAIPLESPPTTQELDADAQNALAETAFPSWDETKEEPAKIVETPLTEEEQTSLGSLVDQIVQEAETGK